MEKAKIHELFVSIQGEGPYAGVRQIFVRLYECNMVCAWCDTPSAIGNQAGTYKEYASEDLLDSVRALNSPGVHSVSFTGGEPLVQSAFLKDFFPQVKASGMRTYLDTNGTLPGALAELIDQVDIVAMDVKLPSSAKCRPFWKEHEAFLRTARRKEVFVKAVIAGGTSGQDVLRCAQMIAAVDPAITCVLQPNYFDLGDGVVEKCLVFARECSGILKDVRVLPQIHKFLKVR